MLVAVDISPTKTGHSVRGIGSYIKNLTEEFKTGSFKSNIVFFENSSSPPPADLVHYPYFDLFFHTLPIRKKAKRVVTIHDVIPLVFPNYFPAGIKGYINLFFQKMALKKVDAVICDSKTSKIDIAEKLSIPKSKIHVVYLAPGKNFRPIDNKKSLNNIAKKYKLPENFILYVGDVNWNKNIINILKAVKHSNAKIVMAGKALTQDIPQTKEIENQIKKLKIQNDVTKLGYVSEADLVAIYNLADLTLMPSFYEGFGLPVLESMACGTPVICSNVASLAEITKNSAVYCDPNDPKDIAKKIKHIQNLSTKARESISEKSIKNSSQFTWEKTAKETIKVYKSVL